MNETDRPPNPGARHGPKYNRKRREVSSMALHEREHPVVFLGVRHPFGKNKVQAAADGEMRDKYVNDGDPRDQDTAADYGNVPKWIIQSGETVLPGPPPVNFLRSSPA